MVLLEFSRYTSDLGGLEKLLRGIQGCLQLAIATDSTLAQSQSWADIAHRHCAVSRRVFRYFRSIDFAAVALATLSRLRDGSEDLVVGSIEIARCICMAVYLFLEAFTILHAMGILSSTWGSRVLLEAMKFWFYAISCSIIGLSYQLLLLRDDKKATVTKKPNSQVNDEKRGGKEPVKAKHTHIQIPRSVLFWQLVGASCDLLIPGTFVEWLDVNPAIVAACSILSSTLSGKEIWNKVNRK